MLIIRSQLQRLFSATNSCICDNINLNQIRTKVRYHLPYPRESKRVRRQGFLKKVQTYNGRRNLMLRILRGDKVIAH